MILICEAGSLKPYEKYLAEFGWTSAENLLFLAGLGEKGSIQQIAGPREDYASRFVQYKRGKSRMQSLGSSGERPYQGKSLLHPAGDCRLHLGDYDTRRMAATRTCVYHVNNEDAGKSHAIARMACCHTPLCIGRLPLVMPTRWHTKGKACNPTVRSP